MSYSREQISGESRFFTRRIFEPISETLSDVAAHTQPRDKRVLAVAAYGGFPLTFLTEGEREVISFDVDRNKIGWNYFLRATVQALSYEESLDFFTFRLQTPPQTT